MASSINASTSGGGGIITTADATGNLNIQSGGSTVVAVTSTGASLTGTLAATGASTFTGTGKFATTIGVGNATPAASGSGITFPATQSASSDANTLDDYEEGTFTPTFTSLTIGNGSTSGVYTKIGNIVTVEVFVTWGSTTSASGAWSINNLPFTSASVGRNFGSCNILDDGVQNYWGGTTISESSVNLAFLALNASATYLTQTNITASVPFVWGNLDTIRAGITYISA